MKQNLITVIIPTYNRAHLIKDAAYSVLNQSYKNIELIIIDDCSTDDTAEVVKSINDPRLNYHRLEKNSGACIARNKGIELARGDYISFNDSDDKWLENKLEEQFKFLNSSNADIVLCKMKCLDENNNFIHDFPLIDGNKQISYKDLLTYNSASTQTFFGKTECFKDIKFDPEMPRLQDWDEALRLSKKYSIMFMDKILVHTFFQKDSISTHPEKGVAAMDKLFLKHKEAIMSDKDIIESFFNKKGAFVRKCGKSPVSEMKTILTAKKNFKTLAKYLLAKMGLLK